MKKTELLPLVFDLDGTIVYDGQNIPETIKNWLKLENKRRQIIFASARPIRDMTSLLTDFPENLWIGGNGSIVKQAGKIQVEKVIDSSDFLTIKSLIEKYDLDFLIDDDWNYAHKISGNSDILKKIDQAKVAKKVNLSEIKQPIKILLLNVDNLDQLSKILSPLNLSIIAHSNENTIDISAKGINKYSTLRKFLPDTGYIAFGNDQNDIQLLENAEKAYIVGTNLQLKTSPQVKNIEKEELVNLLKTNFI